MQQQKEYYIQSSRQADYLTENKRPRVNTVSLSGVYSHDFIKYHHSLQDLNMELFIRGDKNKI